MSKITYLYPKLFNATTKGNIRIVEGCYDEDAKNEIDNYIKQIIDLRNAVDALLVRNSELIDNGRDK